MAGALSIKGVGFTDRQLNGWLYRVQQINEGYRLSTKRRGHQENISLAFLFLFFKNGKNKICSLSARNNDPLTKESMLYITDKYRRLLSQIWAWIIRNICCILTQNMMKIKLLNVISLVNKYTNQAFIPTEERQTKECPRYFGLQPPTPLMLLYKAMITQQKQDF